jgi:hypothetical protein
VANVSPPSVLVAMPSSVVASTMSGSPGLTAMSAAASWARSSHAVPPSVLTRSSPLVAS